MSLNVAAPQSSSIAGALGRQALTRLTTGSLAGLLDSPGQVARAIAALVQAGVERQAIDVVDSRSYAPGNGSPARSTLRLPEIGPERGIARRYGAALNRGAVLLVVRGAGAELRGRAGLALREAGGRAVYDFGRFTVRTVAP